MTYANGDKEVLYFKDFNSGAMIENIVDRAKKMAIKEFLETGQKGLRIAHLLTACVDEFKENEDLPNTTNPDDWARISGKKGERIVYIRTLVSGKQGTEAGRSIDTVANTGQYLYRPRACGRQPVRRRRACRRRYASGRPRARIRPRRPCGMRTGPRRLAGMSVRRVMGIETEYGISVPGQPGANAMVTLVPGGQRLRRPRRPGRAGRAGTSRRRTRCATPAGSTWPARRPTRPSSPTRTSGWPTSS